MLKKKLRAVFLIGIASLLFAVACDSRPSSITTKAWQQSYRQAILEGYSNFRGYYFEDDVGVVIFGYQLTPQITAKDIFDKLIKRLNSDGYKVISTKPNELVMRRPVSYSKYGGFDEYRFVVQEESGRVTVMFANLDSKVELDRYKEFVNEFYKICQSKSP